MLPGCCGQEQWSICVPTVPHGRTVPVPTPAAWAGSGRSAINVQHVTWPGTYHLNVVFGPW